MCKGWQGHALNPSLYVGQKYLIVYLYPSVRKKIARLFLNENKGLYKQRTKVVHKIVSQGCY